MLQTITANRTGIQRRELMHGRAYVVAPVRMIVPGVLVGNRGPLLYVESEIRKSVHAWNGVPVVVNHPRRSGRHVSARTPEVINSVGIGYVYNATIKDGNLDAEAWIDIEKVRQVDAVLAERIERGESIEVSTGLGTENEEVRGTYNGREYEAIARNYAPDHLAILPDERGACSLNDGCGLSVNELSGLVDQYERSGTSAPFSQWYLEMTENETEHGSCQCGGACGKCPSKSKSNTPQGKPMATNDQGRKPADDPVLVNMMKPKEENEATDEEPKKEESLNAKVYAMAKRLAKNMYEQKLFENEMKKSEEMEANMEDEDEEEMNKEKKDAETTANEWLRSAPPEIKRLVRNARLAEQQERDDLIVRITNSNSTITRDLLSRRSIDDLRLFASFVPTSGQIQTSQTPPVYNYLGAAAPAPTANARNPKVEPLGLPKADYMTSKD